MSDDNSNETSMDAEDIAIVFEGAEVFVRRCLGHTCVPLGYPAELAEYDALLRKAIEDVRCVTPGYDPVRQKTTGLARWMNAVKSF